VASLASFGCQPFADIYLLSAAPRFVEIQAKRRETAQTAQSQLELSRDGRQTVQRCL
jgi:hypothetical protein